MKETRNFTLSMYEQVTKVIDVNKIGNKVLKFFVALALMPVFIFVIILALCVEEPLKCIVSLVLMKTTPKKVWIYYKRCWNSLLWGARQWQS